MSVKFENTSINSLGFKLETNPGTPETLTSGNFVGTWTRSPIKSISESYRVDIGGNVGASKIVAVNQMGEISTLTAPLADGDIAGALRTAGSVVEGNSYYWGGNYGKVSGTNSGLVSTSAITFEYFSGTKKYVLYGAKPSSLKIMQKDKEAILLEAAFQGLFSHSNSEITYRQTPPSSFNVNTKGTLSLSGTTFKYTEVELDIKPELTMVPDASVSAGFVQAEIVKVDPTITVTLYPGAPNIVDFEAIYLNRTPVDFSWTFGTGTGNTYTWTGKVVVDAQEEADINAIIGKKITLIPVANNGQDYRLKLTIA